MSPNRIGFTPLVVTSLVVGGMAIITHITAVVYPEWDGIDTQWRPAPMITLPVKAHGSLWDFTLVIDGTRKMFYQPTLQHVTDQAWKKPIVLIATTGIGFGLMGDGLMVLTVVLRKCTNKVFVHLLVNMLSTTSLICVSFECLMGAILYRYNYTKQQAPKDLNYHRGIPYDQHVLRAGFYLEFAAGGLFILTALLFMLDVMISNRKDTSSINPTLNEERVASSHSR